MIKTEKYVYTMKNADQKVGTVIYLLLNYYLYEDLKVSLNSKSKKILITLKNKKIPKNYLSCFSEIIVADSLKYNHIKKIVKKILRSEKKESLRIVSCSEHYFLMAAKLRQDFNISGMSLEKTLNIVNKAKMKELLISKKVPTHNFKIIDKKKIRKNIESYIRELEKDIKYTMFIKPTELYGSEMSGIINSKKDLKNFLLEILKSRLEFEIDEYVSNTILSCDAVLIEGKIVYFRTRIIIGCLFNFLKEGDNYSSCLVPPSHQQYKKGLAMTRRVVSAFGDNLGNRCINFEFIEKNQEELLFLELNYRRPGARACFIFDFSYKNGFNYEALDMDLAFGSKKVVLYKDDFKSDYEFYAGSIIFPGYKKGIVKKINELPELESEIKICYSLKIGEYMEKSPDLCYIPAYIIIRNRNFDQLYREIQRLTFWSPYELE